jgi:hypothetical protein
MSDHRLTIQTNHHEYTLYTWDELPPKARADFDYLTDNERMAFEPRFVKYLGSWYDTHEFSVLPRHAGQPGLLDAATRGWHAYQSDSFFSGVLIRWPRPEEEPDVVQMATYIG